jgi:hypothetical protein
MSSTRLGVWQAAQRGWPADYPLVQFPNPPLLIAFAGLLVAALADGKMSDYGHATFYAGLSAWGWLEVVDGANPPRRILGAAGLVYVVAKVGQAL